MALSPIPLLIIISLSTVFIGLIYGNEIAAASFPQFRSIDFGACDGNELDLIGCLLANIAGVIFNFVAALFGGIYFFFNLISFNVPGTPWYIRTVLGTVIAGTLTWAIMGMVRGN